MEVQRACGTAAGGAPAYTYAFRIQAEMQTLILLLQQMLIFIYMSHLPFFTEPTF